MGFQYRTAGYVLTNRHVVSSSPVGSKVTLRPVRTSQDGSVGLGDPIEGTVRFKHPELDVAVIEIPQSRTASCLLPIATEGGKHVARGLELYAHGFPGTTGPVVTPTISRGLLSAHYEDPLTGQTLYLTDTALSPGSSGGPVTDSRGAVVGDIDLEALDPEGRQVGAHTDDESTAFVRVDKSERGTYTMRYRNAGRSVVIVDSIIFGVPR
jgi:S1-C subfamily serine protease